MYIYVYICIYICICIYMYVRKYIYMYIYINRCELKIKTFYQPTKAVYEFTAIQPFSKVRSLLD